MTQKAMTDLFKLSTVPLIGPPMYALLIAIALAALVDSTLSQQLIFGTQPLLASVGLDALPFNVDGPPNSTALITLSLAKVCPDQVKSQYIKK